MGYVCVLLCYLCSLCFNVFCILFQQRILQLNADISDVCEHALGETGILLSMFIERIAVLARHMNGWPAGSRRSELKMRSLALLKKMQALKLF